MKSKIASVFLFIIFFVCFRFFIGLSFDPEFGDKSLFIKHRPIWKWKFYSPLGMGDMKIEKLSTEKQLEEKYYDEFVIKN